MCCAFGATASIAGFFSTGNNRRGRGLSSARRQRERTSSGSKITIATRSPPFTPSRRRRTARAIRSSLRSRPRSDARRSPSLRRLAALNPERLLHESQRVPGAQQDFRDIAPRREIELLSNDTIRRRALRNVEGLLFRQHRNAFRVEYIKHHLRALDGSELPREHDIGNEHLQTPSGDRDRGWRP